MASKFVIFALLITFALAHGRDISIARSSNEIINTEKESKIVDIPLIGGFFFLACQLIGVLISKAWSLLEYKLAAWSLVSSMISWLLRHSILIIIGTVAVAGLCALTSIFSTEPVYEEIGLVRAARSLDQGIMASKCLIFTLLITFAFAHGRHISNPRSSNEIMRTEKESRIIDMPLIGGFFFLACQLIGVLISKAWSLLEYKLATWSLVSRVISWYLQHSILIIIGTVAVAGFCVLTSIFSTEPVYEEIGLGRAIQPYFLARSLDHGIFKYGRFI